jgi:hypothetical protein
MVDLVVAAQAARDHQPKVVQELLTLAAVAVAVEQVAPLLVVLVVQELLLFVIHFHKF